MIRVGFIPLHNIYRPSSRYRVFQFIEPLSELGFDCSVLDAPERDPFRRLAYVPRLLKFARLNDVLFVQKRTFPGWLLRPLIQANPRIIFDFDDAIYLQPKQKEASRAMLRTACFVTAGNEHLAGLARAYNPNVVIVPTVLDTDKYTPESSFRQSNNRVCIGWVGSDPNFGSLELLVPVFNRLANRYGERVFLRVVASRPFELKMELTSEFVPWSLERSPENLQTIDIGIMPLEDNEWNRAKCGFKLIQYGGVGIPSVASPVGVNQEIIQHGQTGYLAESPDRWLDYLGDLIEHPASRLEMGSAARQWIEEKYSIQAWLPALASILDQTDAGRCQTAAAKDHL